MGRWRLGGLETGWLYDTFQLRARAGYLNAFQNGTMTQTAEYPVYFNCEFTFKGPRRATLAP